MWQAFVVIFFVSLLGSLTVSNFTTTARINRQAAIVSTGQQFNVYGGAVSNWAKVNTGFTGTVSDSSLALPVYVSHIGITNYVTAGKSYIYLSGTSSVQGMTGGVVGYLSKKGNVAGVVSAGTLYSNNGNNLGTVPASIPNGSVVLEL